MSDKTIRLLAGGALIAAGALFLVQQIFNIQVGSLFIGLVFAAASAVFFAVFFQNRERWWALIPGFTMLGLAGLIGAGELFPMVERFGGSFFLGMIALGFIAILLVRKDMWWPLIPAGVLSTLAVVAGLDEVQGIDTGGIFFLGIGATFALLALLPIGREQKWPWIPAAVCLVMGFAILIKSAFEVQSLAGWIWAVALLVAGAYLVIRSLTRKKD